MRRINSANIDAMVLLYSALIIAILAKFSTGTPLYDVYNSDNEPGAIPMHFLKVPMQSNFDNSIFENEVSGKAYKRNRNQIILPLNTASSSESCCPTIIDVVEPSHGKNRSGDLVELFQSDTVRQLFYENSCAPSIANAPCRYLDRRHSIHSRCVQQYSYTYAMVRDMANENAEWKLDYIQVRSGCSCHISNT